MARKGRVSISEKLVREDIKKLKKKKHLPKIFEKEQKAFYKLWHTYHAKYQMPYSYDEAERLFNSLLEIFKGE